MAEKCPLRLLTTLGAITDLDGSFTIRHLRFGAYTLVASMIGYSSTKVNPIGVTP